MKKRISLLITLFLCVLAHSQYVNIKDYGASISLADNSTQIQKAIDENPNRTIFFPSGKFNVLKTIVINHPVEIMGEGINNTIFQPVNCNGFLINSSNVTVKNMFIYGYENDSKSYTGIYCYGKKDNSIYRLNFESLKFQNIKIGIELKYAWDCIIDKVKTLININQSPRILQGIRFYGQSVNNHISNCHIESEGIGVAIIRARTDDEQTTLVKDLKSPRAEGLMITNSFIGSGNYGIYSEGILSMNVSNCTIDLTKRTAIEGTRTDGLLLSNNWIALILKEELNHPIIKLISSGNAHISNNNIQFTNNNKLDEYSIVNNVGVSFEDYTNSCTVIGNTFKEVNHKTLNYTGAANNIVIYNIAN